MMIPPALKPIHAQLASMLLPFGNKFLCPIGNIHRIGHTACFVIPLGQRLLNWYDYCGNR